MRAFLARLAKRQAIRKIAHLMMSQSVRARLGAAVIGRPSSSDFHHLLSQASESEYVPGKVIMVCGSLQAGGAERQVANTLIGLSQRGLKNLTLLCDYLHSTESEKYDFYLPLAQTSGAEIRTIRSSWKASTSAFIPTRLKKARPVLDPNLVRDVTNLFLEFRELRPETVHAWLDWSNVRAGLAAILAGVPHIILSGRNLSPRHFLLNTDYYLPAYTAILEKGAGQVSLINNSRAGADDYADWLSVPNTAISVLRNGVHFGEDIKLLGSEAKALRQRFGIPLDVPVLGGMFRFAAEKRPLLWLEAASRISKTLPSVHFMLFGNGSMRDEITEKVRALGLQRRVHLCGVVTPAAHALSACDVVLLTSAGEGTPNVLLEAQWLGLPVVTTDAGGAAEAVLDGITGHVVRNPEANDVADAVLKILEDQDFCAAMRERGPAFVKERYGLDRMIAETIALYRDGKTKSVPDKEPEAVA